MDMKPELVMLLWAVALTFAQVLIATIGAMLQVGLPKLAGNREAMPEITGWAGRAARAHRNMLENLVLFAALVLIVLLTNKANATTLLGAQLFVWARIVYAAVYIAGLPWLRTVVWFVSIVGLGMMFAQLV
jgi:uncharacterized MAPEG superfamily protein